MTGNEIRKKYIDFFKKNNHEVVRSSSLVPSNDPTLLFTNAGMVQFKRIFLGEEKRHYVSATSSQKCVRAGGKHNDLENVGYTARHQTFFEMLGNFSFGNYFKQKAIELAWDLIVNEYKLPDNKLLVSVYDEDHESYKIWKQNIGISEDKITCLGTKENFWSMGDTGPCGPSSEIYIDRGKDFSCGKLECGINCDCDRFIEVWNLVFMQFNRDNLGNMIPLPRPCIDTGLGLERLASIIQGVKNNFETDLILPIIRKTEILAKIEFGVDEKYDIAMKVIADHIRAAAFIIGDGVIPSNEGRGYVLRRIIRRAIRYGRNLNLIKPFLHNLVQEVFDIMELPYPELKNSSNYICNVLKNEEIQFSETLDNGLKVLNNYINEIHSKGERKISGNLIFKLHDTYGFPIDIIQDIARDRKVVLDLNNFHKNMNKQRKKSYSKKKINITSKTYQKLSSTNLESKFVRNDSLSTTAKVILLIEKEIEVTKATKEAHIEIITDQTTFFGESGGQIGDQGEIKADGLRIFVKNTTKNSSGIVIHSGTVLNGTITIGQTVKLIVDKNNRTSISQNHTSTHLLQAVLCKRLGNHIRQSGSLVSSDKLRFDFTHFSKISHEDLNKIEETINKKIFTDIPITTLKMPLQKAIESGAKAPFEERYKEEVRVVSIDTLSKELCGGTHVKRTGNIGLFIITSEYGIASGIRRIEAITGYYALKYIQNLRESVKKTSSQLKVPLKEISNKINDIKTTNKLLKKEIEKITLTNAILKIKSSENTNSSNISNNSTQYSTISGIKTKIEQVEVKTSKELREMADYFKNELNSGIVALGSKQNNKALLIVGVTKDLTDRFNASKIVREISTLIKGKGGGRSDMAQAGGKEPQNIKKALERIKTIIKNNNLRS